jgi:hypothetical protein
VFLIIFYVFSSTKEEKKRAEHVLPGSGEGGEVAQIMYTHVSRCKNDKIKGEKKKKISPQGLELLNTGCSLKVLSSARK